MARNRRETLPNGVMSKRVSQTRDSMHASRLVLWAAAFALGSSGCSERAQTPDAPTPPQAAGERQPREPSFDATSLHKLSSKATAAGIEGRYDAYFDGEQLKAIVESRSDPAGHGEYHYMGARLLEYTGSLLDSGSSQSNEEIQLRFDLQGALISAVNRADAQKAVEQSQIDALRARAQLLRSHALTQRSVSVHRHAAGEHG
jgi:hypothetical protein